MKYDDVSFHVDEVESAGLPYEAGATHIAFYFAWLVLNDLVKAEFVSDFSEEIEKLKSKSVSPRSFFMQNLDGKFSDEDLNKLGKEFSDDYYNLEKGCPYLRDYESEVVKEGQDIYAVSDDWNNYEKLASVINIKFSNWKRGSVGFFKKIFG
jgi:hypothetical protein